MATFANPAHSHNALDTKSPEQALCTIFDIVEDAIQKLPTTERKSWLDALSETAERLEKRA